MFQNKFLGILILINLLNNCVAENITQLLIKNNENQREIIDLEKRLMII
jgi:hypothetical protein